MGQDEILANRIEDDLLRELTAAMRARGFTLLGVLAICDKDNSVATFGDAKITQSAEFGDLLHDLGEQIRLDAKPSHSVHKKPNGRVSLHSSNLANLHLCRRPN